MTLSNCVNFLPINWFEYPLKSGCTFYMKRCKHFFTLGFMSYVNRELNIYQIYWRIHTPSMPKNKKKKRKIWDWFQFNEWRINKKNRNKEDETSCVPFYLFISGWEGRGHDCKLLHVSNENLWHWDTFSLVTLRVQFENCSFQV